VAHAFEDKRIFDINTNRTDPTDLPAEWIETPGKGPTEKTAITTPTPQQFHRLPNIEEGVEERQIELMRVYIMKKLREKEVSSTVAGGGLSAAAAEESTLVDLPCDSPACTKKLGDTVMMCNWCGDAAYCCSECQENDWDRHMSDTWVSCSGPAIDDADCAGKNQQEAVKALFDAVSDGIANGAARVKDVESLIQYYESNDAFKLRNSRALSWLQEVHQQLLQAPDVDSDSECDEQGVPLEHTANQFIGDLFDDH